MNKVLLKILAASLLANGIGVLAVLGLCKYLTDAQNLASRTHNWSEIMNQIIMTHYKNGGEFLLSSELEQELEAYLLMARNGLG